MNSTVNDRLTSFLDALRAADWDGTIRTDRAACVVLSTDNSIYQRLPSAVLEPRNLDAMSSAMTCAAEAGVAITARGGGTGTNGQSLSDAVVMDCSRHMNRILHLDEGRGVAVVEPGVVLDQLNAAARPLGWMFGPTVSTASRATIGGMVSTDASGKGSRRFGRTSDHLQEVEVVYADGSVGAIRDLSHDEVVDAAAIDDLPGRLLALLSGALPRHRAEIDRVFPEMNRGLTGYNLKQVQRSDGGLNLTRLLAGSEGTLALIGRITLRLTRVPRYRGAAVIGYRDCDSALRAVPDLLVADPDAIEFLDDRVLKLGRGATGWRNVAPLLGELADAGGLLFAEVSGDDATTVTDLLKDLHAAAQALTIPTLGVRDTQDATQMAALSALRSEAVGLLASGEGPGRGIPFVEDAAVPPEHLVDFVGAFRALLDGEALEYGMFGHADLGCVHVRPMLDMLSPEDRARIRPISDAVAALVKRYGGLLWGEHGKGVRGEYLADRVGPGLYGLMEQIKTVCDPQNLLNPGKLVQPEGSDGHLLRIDSVPFRGVADAAIPVNARRDFNQAISCNGNGACFDWSPDRTMCPSFKATRDRVQSPKGRAALIRDWQQQLAADSNGAQAKAAAVALGKSLETCLSCKACTSLCPVRVDIPTMKARFLSDHHARTPRSLRDRLVRWMQRLTLLARRAPRLADTALSAPPVRMVLGRGAGLCDLPHFAQVPFERSLARKGVALVDPGRPRLRGNSGNAAILLTDSFLGTFDTGPLLGAAKFMQRMGIDVHATPPLLLGKALHVRGHLAEFESLRARMLPRLAALADTGAPLVAVEPAIIMAFRQEWQLAVDGPRILSLEEFLHARCDLLPHPSSRTEEEFGFLPHCTQMSADPDHARLWKEIFAACDLNLAVEQVGCCGMAGLFGHESEHVELSHQIFDMFWKTRLAPAQRQMTASGFSCRCQVRRFAKTQLMHPVEALHAALLA